MHVDCPSLFIEMRVRETFLTRCPADVFGLNPQNSQSAWNNACSWFFFKWVKLFFSFLANSCSTHEVEFLYIGLWFWPSLPSLKGLGIHGHPTNLNHCGLTHVGGHTPALVLVLEQIQHDLVVNVCLLLWSVWLFDCLIVIWGHQFWGRMELLTCHFPYNFQRTLGNFLRP